MDRVLDLLHTVKWRAGRHADLPPLLRPRRVRLGRDAHQRPQPARLQDPGRPAGPEDHASRRCRACRWSRTWSSTWTASSPSTAASSRTSIDDRPDARARAAPVARATARATTTPPSASCAPPAPAPARRSGPSPATSGRPRSSTPTASSSTRATRRAEERLEILADEDGVWRCRTIFNCVDACPRGINITQADPGGLVGRSSSGTPERPLARRRRRPRARARWSSARTGRPRQPRPGLVRARSLIDGVAAGRAATPTRRR